MRKRVVTLALLICMTCSSAACGSSKPVEATIPTATSETESVAETAGEEDTEIEETTEEPTEEPETNAKEESSSDGISPEFKDAMDSYEAFFDEYVEFMKNYAESEDTLSMMGDYADYMAKYADAMEKMDGIKEEDLSTEEYTYYIEVMAHIQKKLLEIPE